MDRLCTHIVHASRSGTLHHGSSVSALQIELLVLIHTSPTLPVTSMTSCRVPGVLSFMHVLLLLVYSVSVAYIFLGQYLHVLLVSLFQK